jgi:putative SOS response-associated peptidase YedK
MCGRFTVVIDIAEIFKHYGFDYYKRDQWEPQYNFSPSNRLPIVKNEIVEEEKWGFTYKENFVINIRSEGYFSQSQTFNTCLIPADGYFEWQNKVPYYFQREDGSPMLFAGLFRDEGFAILTKQAQDDVTHIHHRMPLIIPNRETALNFLKNRTYPNEKIELTYLEVNPIVNNSRTNSPLSIQEATQKQLRLF